MSQLLPRKNCGFVRSRRDDGVALVIVLAFIVLLTGLVVAYFTRSMADRQLSNSSFNQAKADQLATSALAVITGDLRQEIANGSTAIPASNPNNYPLAYIPTAEANMVPVKNGVPTGNWGPSAPLNTPNTTLLRVSSTAAIAAPGVDHKASNAPTTTMSANGRSVSLVRWNKSYLIPLKAFGTPTDPTPPATFTAPNWVYVTGDGPTELSAPKNDTIGRYAYAIYDEGALLDVNVAGYPADGTATVTPAQYSPKGSSAFADLTALFAGNAITPTQKGVNSLVGWRNFASMQPTGTFPSLAFSGTAMLDTYKNLVTKNTNGFTTVNVSSSTGAQTDQAFLTRQDLINVVQAIGTTNFNANNLQFLGTFSRAVTTPSWYPTADSTNLSGYKAGALGTSPVAYKTNADSNSSANRNLLNLRFSSAATITHYKDDGTHNAASDYSVQAGRPFVQRRFSLARLDWLTYQGPKAGISPDAVKACFGLQWGTDPDGNPCWQYVGPSGGTPQPSIKTLGEIAAEPTPREPNFFELLKAGILSGSLGRDPGAGSEMAGQHVYSYNADFLHFEGPVNTGLELYSASADAQIIQIGANIIDQFDTDSYPTAIYFKFVSSDPSTPVQGNWNMFYGIENLPYLQKIHHMGYNTDSTSVDVWYQPELWNPHQEPPATWNGLKPTQFRMVAHGKVSFNWNVWISNPPALPAPQPPPLASGLSDHQVDYDTSPTEANIYFTDTVGTTSPFYAHPQLLNTSMNTSNAPMTDAVNMIPLGNGTVPAGPLPYKNTFNNVFMGFHVGRASPAGGGGTYPVTTMDAGTTASTMGGGGTGSIYSRGMFIRIDPLLTFCLQYKDASGNYRPYSYTSRMAISGDYQGGSAFTGAIGQPYVKADPRTDRFGICAGVTYGGWRDNSPWFSTDQGAGLTGAGVSSWWSSFLYDMQANTPTSGSWPLSYCVPRQSAGFFYSGTQSTPPASFGTASKQTYLAGWAINQPTHAGLPPARPTYASIGYYADPDGVVRPGDALRCDMTTGDGCVPFNFTQPTTLSGLNASKVNRRPVILNRPFRTVADMGYAYRDQPFKSVDFFSSASADGALLDLFSVADQPPIVAGQINPNNAPVRVLQAVLGGSLQMEIPTSPLTSPLVLTPTTYAAPLATNLLKQFQPSTGKPAINRADVVRAVSDAIDASTTLKEPRNKACGEAVTRALSEVTNTRTWNLMIDVIAQTGTFSPTAPATPAALGSSFNVQGERRYWLHVAIDRFTGKVIDQQLEPVYE